MQTPLTSGIVGREVKAGVGYVQRRSEAPERNARQEALLRFLGERAARELADSAVSGLNTGLTQSRGCDAGRIGGHRFRHQDHRSLQLL